MMRHIKSRKSAPLLTGVIMGGVMLLTANTLWSGGKAEPPPKHNWSFEGPRGTFDRAALQRGYQVYKEVCSTCHALNRLRFRDLAHTEQGLGLGYSMAQIKTLAAEFKVKDGPNDQGEYFERPGRPADRLPSPYPNEKAARAANNGAYPVDLSLITKARKNGPDYLRALLLGYREPPAEFKLGPGMHYNIYFPGYQIMMAPPLKEGLVTYADGTKATPEQMADDVVTFLAWAADPLSENRKELGFKVMIYMALLTILLYLSMRRVWKKVKS